MHDYTMHTALQHKIGMESNFQRNEVTICSSLTCLFLCIELNSVI
jgi:hypothetical protein